jgi:putative hydrolase of the HAD superfamily
MRPVLVFDLDDTLYLERDYVRSGFAAVGAWALDVMDVPEVGDTAWQLFLDGARRTTLGDAFAQLGRPLAESELREAVRIYRDHVPDITLCPDARETLLSLRGRADLGLITDGPQSSQRAKIEALRLRELIAEIIVTDEHPGWGKPAEYAFADVERRFGTGGERYTYVADNPIKDFIAPLALGWRGVRVIRPGSLHASAPTPEGVDVIESFDDAAWLASMPSLS